MSVPRSLLCRRYGGGPLHCHAPVHAGPSIQTLVCVLLACITNRIGFLSNSRRSAWSTLRHIIRHRVASCAPARIQRPRRCALSCRIAIGSLPCSGAFLRRTLRYILRRTQALTRVASVTSPTRSVTRSIRGATGSFCSGTRACGCASKTASVQGQLVA